jgi:maltose alpha-D-glucosyltransferase/alpha-amylase
MLRSFDYAVHSALSEQRQSGLNEEMARVAREWGQLWQAWVSVEFLRSYLESVRDASILKAPPDEIEVLLSTYVLEKVVYELAYELNNRPDWLIVPLRGMLELVQSGP